MDFGQDSGIRIECYREKLVCLVRSSDSGEASGDHSVMKSGSTHLLQVLSGETDMFQEWAVEERHWCLSAPKM